MYLNCHSYFSFLYGALSPQELFDEARKHKVKKLVLTDINNTSGYIELLRLCEENRLEYDLQIALGIGVIIEVIRRLVVGSAPVSVLMIVTGIVAFGANITCLILLAKHRAGEVHMRASWIFSTNDVIANAGVVLSGLLVMWSGSRIPDLVIGAVVSVVVIRGGRLILLEARCPRE